MRDKSRFAPRVGATLACAGMAFLLAACNATVNEFTAVPRHICVGERVDLNWSIVGSGTVKVTPPTSGLPDGPVPDQGHATIVPVTTTQVALHVTRTLGNPPTSTQTIEVKKSADRPEALTASMRDATANPGCGGGKAWATVHARRFAADLKVATVSAHPGDDRS